MKAVPDVVQHVAVTADKQECQHQNCPDFFPYPDRCRAQKRSHQCQRQHAASQIRQAVLCRRFMETDEVCRKRAPALIELHRGRENVIDAIGQLQRIVCRQKHDRRQCTAQQRSQQHCNGTPRQLCRFQIEHAQAHVGDHCENAGEHTDIKIGEKRKSQSDHIETVFSVTHQVNQAHERQKCNCIHPDDVPVVAQDVAAKRIHHSKKADGKVISAKCSTEKQRKKQAGTADFQEKYHCDCFTQNGFRNQNGEQIQRTCRIIRKNGEKVCPHTGIPGIQKRTAAPEFFMQQPQKRIILVPKICYQYLSVSKGVYLLQDKSHCQKQHRDAKRQQQNQSSAAFLSGFSGGGCLGQRCVHENVSLPDDFDSNCRSKQQHCDCHCDIVPARRMELTHLGAPCLATIASALHCRCKLFCTVKRGHQQRNQNRHQCLGTLHQISLAKACTSRLLGCHDLVCFLY